MTPPTDHSMDDTRDRTEERRKSTERRVRPHKGWIGRQPENIRQDGPDRRDPERERRQKHYGAMLEDSRDIVDARRYQWLRVAAINKPEPPVALEEAKTPEEIDAAIDAEILKEAKP